MWIAGSVEKFVPAVQAVIKKWLRLDLDCRIGRNVQEAPKRASRPPQAKRGILYISPLLALWGAGAPQSAQEAPRKRQRGFVYLSILIFGEGEGVK